MGEDFGQQIAVDLVRVIERTGRSQIDIAKYCYRYLGYSNPSSVCTLINSVNGTSGYLNDKKQPLFYKRLSRLFHSLDVPEDSSMIGWAREIYDDFMYPPCGEIPDSETLESKLGAKKEDPKLPPKEERIRSGKLVSRRLHEAFLGTGLNYKQFGERHYKELGYGTPSSASFFMTSIFGEGRYIRSRANDAMQREFLERVSRVFHVLKISRNSDAITAMRRFDPRFEYDANNGKGGGK